MAIMDYFCSKCNKGLWCKDARCSSCGSRSGVWNPKWQAVSDRIVSIINDFSQTSPWTTSVYIGITRREIKARLLWSHCDLKISLNTIKSIIDELICSGKVVCINPEQPRYKRYRTDRHGILDDQKEADTKNKENKD